MPHGRDGGSDGGWSSDDIPLGGTATPIAGSASPVSSFGRSPSLSDGAGWESVVDGGCSDGDEIANGDLGDRVASQQSDGWASLDDASPEAAAAAAASSPPPIARAAAASSPPAIAGAAAAAAAEAAAAALNIDDAGLPLVAAAVKREQGLRNAFVLQATAQWPPVFPWHTTAVTHYLSTASPGNFSSNSATGKALAYVYSNKLPETHRPLRTNTWKGEAQQAGVSEKLYKRRFFEMASLTFLLTRMFWASFAARVFKLIEETVFEGVLLVFIGQSDEASAKLRVDNSDRASDVPGQQGNSKHRKNTQTAKVLQSELRIGMLLRDRQTDAYTFMTGQVPCLLAAVDRGTAECLYQVHKDAYTMHGIPDEFVQSFKTVCTCHTQDKCAANEKLLNAARHDDKQREADAQVKRLTRLTFGCDIHRAATLTTRVFDLVKFHISGLLALAISQRGAGQFDRLRTLVGEACVAKLRIVRGGAIHPEAFAFKKAFLDLVLPSGDLVNADTQCWRSGGMARTMTRYMFDQYFNGDIRDTHHVWHHVAVDGPSDEQICDGFLKEAAFALLPAMLDHFPRHRWTGAGKVICSAALFAGTHGLLHSVVPQWLDGRRSARGAAAAAEPAAPAVVSDGYVSEPDDNPVVAEFGDSGVSKPTEETWSDWNSRMKVDAVQWALSNPAAALHVLAVVVQPLSRLIEDFLFLAGERWDTINDWRTTNGEGRRFRVLEAHRVRHERQCAAHALSLLQRHDQWGSFPVECMTLATRGLAFRSLARTIAGVQLLLVSPRQGFPCALFGLLEDPGLAQQFALSPVCMRDDFSNDHIAKYGDALGGKESLFVLACIADSVRLDTSRIETGHSYWQREARLKGFQTVADSLPSISATWVLHKQRIFEACGKKSVPAQRPGSKPHIGKVQRKSKKPKRVRGWRGVKDITVFRHGGGGAWRAFCSQHAAKGAFGGSVFRGLAARYKALVGTPAFQQLLAVGQAATRARGTTASGNPFKPAGGLGAVCLVDAAPQAQFAAIVPFAGKHDVPAMVIMALAIAGTQSTNLGKQTLRKVCLKIARNCRQRESAIEDALLTWSGDRAEIGSAGFQGNSCFGIPLPTYQGLHKVECPAPAIAAAKHVLTAAGDPVTQEYPDLIGGGSSMYSLHSKLRLAWEAQHRVCKHDQLPALDGIKPSPLSASPCRLLGVCLCERPDLKAFRVAFIAVLKTLFKKDPGNMFKQLCEDGFGFLQLEWFAVDADIAHDPPSQTDWVHISYVNQQSWAVAVMRAVPDPDLDNRRIARACGHVALRIAPLPTIEQETDPFTIAGVDTVPHFFLNADMSRSCRCSLYELFESSREVLAFVPGEIEVRCRSEKPIGFWPGLGTSL